jgi:hypothetical protein
MYVPSLEKVGGISLIVGSLLLTAYAALFPVLLPIGSGTYDYVQVVLNPHWVRLAMIALIGVLLMLIGFYAVYQRVRVSSGVVGAIGFLFIEAAYLLQACKVTWEFFLYPIIAAHPESAFLLGNAIIKNDPAVLVFRSVASLTIMIGIVLFCFTLYRSDEYPKAGTVLIFGGALVYAIGPMISIFVSVAGIFTLAFGCLLIGLRLFRVQNT